MMEEDEGVRTVDVPYRDRTYRFQCVAGDHITRQLAAGHFYEQDLLEAVKAKQITGCYIDVGAFIGTHSVWFAAECRASRVISLEPNEVPYRLLLKNTRTYAQIIRVRAAIHDEWTKVSSILTNAVGNLGMSRIAEGGIVPAIALDELSGYDPDVIKIDVEGMECNVLRSGLRVIERRKPLLIVETANELALREVTQILSPLGYMPEGPYAKTPTWIWSPRAG